MFVAGAALLGAGLRIAVVLDPGFPRRSPIIDDAYYSFSVARNLGQGNGPTVDGKHFTNGFQPLTTVLAAGLFALRLGDDVFSVRFFMVFSLVISFLNAALVGSLARRLTAHPAALLLGLAAYLLWPIAFLSDLNGLETGYTTFLLLASLAFFPQIGQVGGWHWRLGVFGLLLGLLTLCRIDGLVTVAVFAVLHWLAGEPVARRLRFLQACWFSVIAIVVASPWFWYNWYVFQSLIPVSGHASMRYSTRYALGDPLHVSIFSRTVRALWDNVFLYPIETVLWRLPESRILHVAILVLWLAGVVGIIWWRLRSSKDEESGTWRFRKFAVAFCVTHLLVMAFVYAWVFDTSRWFIQRYLYPSTAVTLPVALYLIWPLMPRAGVRLTDRGRALFVAVGLAYALFYMVSSVRWFRATGNEEFYDLATHLRENYAGKSIAMLQSGTVGFFVGSVTNLDGKVNREVNAYWQDGRIVEYLGAKGFDVIADWSEAIEPLLMEWASREGDYAVVHYGRFTLFVKRERTSR